MKVMEFQEASLQCKLSCDSSRYLKLQVSCNLTSGVFKLNKSRYCVLPSLVSCSGQEAKSRLQYEQSERIVP